MSGQYTVESVGPTGYFKLERTFITRHEALVYRDTLLDKARGLACTFVVTHPDVEGYVEWQEDDPLVCPDCGHITNDGERCGECLSERASYFVPDEGGESA